MPAPKRKPKFGRIYKKWNKNAEGVKVEHSTWTIRYKGRDYSTGTDDWNEANRELLKIASRHEEAKARVRKGASSLIVSDLLDDLVRDYKRSGNSSLQECEISVRLHLRPIVGDIRISKFGTAEIESYVQKRQAEDNAPANSTINRELALLKRAFSIGYNRQPPRVDRIPNFEMLPVNNIRTGFLSIEDYSKLLEHLPGYLRPLLVVGYHAGNRRSELTSLRWQDVFLDDDNPHFILWAGTTKNKEGRTIPIYGDMVEVFRQMERDREPGSDFVFTRDGKRLLTWYKAWKTACAAAGMPDLMFHDLRRSAVRNLTRSKVPRVIAKKITGHKTDSVYERYDIVDPEDLADAAAKVDAYIAGKKKK
jgi:integrase